MSLLLSLSVAGVAHADASKAEAQKFALPDVLGAIPKDKPAFLHAVITADDVAALSENDEKMIRAISAGEGDDGYLQAGFITAALVEARELGASAIVVGKPLLRTQTLTD